MEFATFLSLFNALIFASSKNGNYIMKISYFNQLKAPILVLAIP